MSNRVWIAIVVTVLIVGGLGYGLFVDTGAVTGGTPVGSAESGTKSKAVTRQERSYPMAPDFVLKDLDGNMVQLSKFRGKVVIIDFWATWCGPCRMEIPHFIELQNEYGEDNLVILGVSLDQGDLSVVGKFAESYGINYRILYYTQQVIAAYGGIQSIPTTFIVDRQGKVRERAIGYRDKAFFKSRIDKLL